jgi:hypothetical protein
MAGIACMNPGFGVCVPNQNKTQRSSLLSIDEFLRITQQNVHVGIDALEGTLVLGLAPFQADDHLGADSVGSNKSVSVISKFFDIVFKEHIEDIHENRMNALGSWGIAYLACKYGRGLTGWN